MTLWKWLAGNLHWILIVVVAVLTATLVPYVFRWHPSYGVLKNDLQNTVTLTLDGSKRSIITKGEFACAEPAPDAMAVIATEIASSLGGRSGESGIDAELNMISEGKVENLFRRTQGIQAIRDGMFRLCESQMNGAISKEFYEEQMIDLLMTLNFIVPLELCINASTRMGELYAEIGEKAAMIEEVQGAQATVPEAAEDNLRDYMLLCLDTAKGYGLTLAENAAGRLKARRDWQNQLALEQVRIATFRNQSASAPLGQ